MNRLVLPWVLATSLCVWSVPVWGQNTEPSPRPSTLPELLQDYQTPFSVRLLAWGYVQLSWNPEHSQLALDLLKDRDPRVRWLAAHSLAWQTKSQDATVSGKLLTHLNDRNGMVRRAIAKAIGTINAPDAADVLVSAFQSEQSGEPVLIQGLLQAIERTGKIGPQRLLDLARSGNDVDRNRVVEAFPLLRSRAAGLCLPELISDPHVTNAQRLALIQSFKNYQLDPPLALEPLFDLFSEAKQDDFPLRIAVLNLLTSQPSVQGMKAVAFLQSLLDVEEEAVRITVLQVIEAHRLSEFTRRLLERLADRKRSTPERIALVRALGSASPSKPETAMTYKKILQSDEEAAELKAVTLAKLASMNPTMAYDLAVPFLEQSDPNLLRETITILGTQIRGAELLAERFLKKKLSRDFLPGIVHALQTQVRKEAALAKWQKQVLKQGFLNLNEVEAQGLQHWVLTQGNTERGQELFFQASAISCASCHHTTGKEQAVGPNLSRLWETHSLPKIMEAILEPSKDIKANYQSVEITTKQGPQYLGRKREETSDDVTLRTADGKDVVIHKSSIQKIQPAQTSVMPENLLQTWSFEQILDLLAFLKSREAQATLWDKK